MLCNQTITSQKTAGTNETWPRLVFYCHTSGISEVSGALPVTGDGTGSETNRLIDNFKADRDDLPEKDQSATVLSTIRGLSRSSRQPNWLQRESKHLKVWFIWYIYEAAVKLLWVSGVQHIISCFDGSESENSKLKVHFMALDERRGKRSFSI